MMVAIVALWVYILSIFQRGKIQFSFFFVGSVGLFLIMLGYVEPLIQEPLSELIARSSSVIGHWLGLNEAYDGNQMVMIQGNQETMLMVIDFECAGMIEILAFISLLWFFPVYGIGEKLFLSLGGILYIYSANVLRILLISAMVYQWGNGIYYLAHAIIARIVFYILSAVLYFYVFTKSQIIRQKVGNVHYEII